MHIRFAYKDKTRTWIGLFLNAENGRPRNGLLRTAWYAQGLGFPRQNVTAANSLGNGNRRGPRIVIDANLPEESAFPPSPLVAFNQVAMKIVCAVWQGGLTR